MKERGEGGEGRREDEKREEGKEEEGRERRMRSRRRRGRGERKDDRREQISLPPSTAWLFSVSEGTSQPHRGHGVR